MAQQILYAAAFPAADTEIYGRKGGELTTNQGTAAPLYWGSTSCSCLTGLILLQLSLDKPLMVPFTGVFGTGVEAAPSARNHDLAKQEGTIHPSNEGIDDTYPKTLNMECSLNTDDLIWRERESMEIMSSAILRFSIFSSKGEVPKLFILLSN